MDVLYLLLAVLLLGLNAFFVGSEFALITARRDQLEPLAARGSRPAQAALRGVEHLSLMLAGSQLGITLCSLGLGALGEPAVAHLLEVPLHAVGVPDALLHPIAFAVALVIVVFLHMVIGEMVPKNLAIAGPVRAALALGVPAMWWLRLAKPVIVALNAMANATLRLLRIEPRDELETAYTGEELAALIAESRAEGYLPPETEDRLARTISTERRTAKVVALGWDAMVTLRRDATGAEAEGVVQRSGFSRFPICGEGRSLVGYLHAKDLLSLEPNELDRRMPERIVRPLARVSADAPIADAVVSLRRDGAHLGKVVGGDGAVLGVVALEDLLEEYVGQLNATPPVSDRDVTTDEAPGLAEDVATSDAPADAGGAEPPSEPEEAPGRDATSARGTTAAG